jgi:hypothetical protein
MKLATAVLTLTGIVGVLMSAVFVYELMAP